MWSIFVPGHLESSQQAGCGYWATPHCCYIRVILVPGHGQWTMLTLYTVNCDDCYTNSDNFLLKVLRLNCTVVAYLWKTAHLSGARGQDAFLVIRGSRVQAPSVTPMWFEHAAFGRRAMSQSRYKSSPDGRAAFMVAGPHRNPSSCVQYSRVEGFGGVMLRQYQ